MTSITRRAALAGASATLGGVQLRGAIAQTPSTQLIVPIGGGSYGGFAEKSFEDPILKNKGIKVIRSASVQRGARRGHVQVPRHRHW
jgi:hypothetical protein